MGGLHSIADILAATGGEPRNLAAREISSVTIDSRAVLPGALFVAIKGENFDGHDFVTDAVSAGAAVAMVSRSKVTAIDPALPLIVVPDALEGLAALAHYVRARSSARIVAVTGSVGKTSTKDAIRAILAEAGETHAAIRSFNNHWGVPLTLARMPASAAYGVFEIGMNHAGEITPLSRLVRPHVAVVTAIAPAHLEFFDSVAAIADAKAEIFAGLEPGGLAILNLDHDHGPRLVAHAKGAEAAILTYGYSDNADVRIEGYTASPGGGRARIAGDGLDLALEVPTPGRHTVSNAVAALLVGRAFGVDPAQAVRTLASLGAPEGRGQALSLGPPDTPLVLIDESYNANPTSMRAALDVFALTPRGRGRKVLVLGDMRELGTAADALHAELALDVMAAEPDAVYLVGPHMKALTDTLPAALVAGWSQTSDEIAQSLLADLAYGDVVMVKGSNGLRLGALVARIRGQF